MDALRRRAEAAEPSHLRPGSDTRGVGRCSCALGERGGCSRRSSGDGPREGDGLFERETGAGHVFVSPDLRVEAVDQVLLEMAVELFVPRVVGDPSRFAQSVECSP